MPAFIICTLQSYVDNSMDGYDEGRCLVGELNSTHGHFNHSRANAVIHGKCLSDREIWLDYNSLRGMYHHVNSVGTNHIAD